MNDQYQNNTELFGWHCSWFGGKELVKNKLESLKEEGTYIEQGESAFAFRITLTDVLYMDLFDFLAQRAKETF